MNAGDRLVVEYGLLAVSPPRDACFTVIQIMREERLRPNVAGYFLLKVAEKPIDEV